MMQEKTAELERWQKAATMADSMQALTDEQTKGSQYRDRQRKLEPELKQLQEETLYWGKEEEFLNAERSAQSEYKLEQERLTRVIGWFDEAAQLTRQEEENKKNTKRIGNGSKTMPRSARILKSRKTRLLCSRPLCKTLSRGENVWPICVKRIGRHG